MTDPWRPDLALTKTILEQKEARIVQLEERVARLEVENEELRLTILRVPSFSTGTTFLEEAQ